VVEQLPDGPPRPFFKLRWPIRAHSEYILPRRSEIRAEQAPAAEYWADGLEPIYLEGAFARAQGRLL